MSLPNHNATCYRSHQCHNSFAFGLVALDIGPDDVVIVPAFTWVSTAMVLYQRKRV